METMYERIKRLRLEKGMSQDELAIKSGYTGRAAISIIEKGERNISADKIFLIAKALNVTPSYLMDGDTKKSATNDYHQKVAEILSQIPEDKKEEFLEYLKAAVKMLKD